MTDDNGKEAVGIAGPGEENQPVPVEQGQTIEYQITVTRRAAKENISDQIIVTDALPEGTAFMAGSIKGGFTIKADGSKAKIESMTYKMVRDSEGNERPGVEWILSGLSDGEQALLTFRVLAPRFEAQADGTNSRTFTNTAVMDDGDEPVKSNTTYHSVKAEIGKQGNGEKPKPPGKGIKTGDYRSTLPAVILLAGAFAIIIGLTTNRRRKRMK